MEESRKEAPSVDVVTVTPGGEPRPEDLPNGEGKVLTGTTTKLTEFVDEKNNNRVVLSTHIGGGPHVADEVVKKGGASTATLCENQNSKTHDYYAADGFGKIDIIEKPFLEKTYNVNFHPLGINQSPFKETPPTIEDIQPITGYNKALCHENAYVYTLNVPDRYKKVDEKDELETITGACSTQSIPALTILRNNLLGAPPVIAEYPVVASANPSCAASYLHAVQHRMSKHGALDLRFNLCASSKEKLKETYILGRIWLPLNKMTIYWDLAAENYDAAQPILYPAFAEMGKVTLDTRKELTSLVQNLRFVDKTFSPDIEQSIIRIMQMVANTKMSLSRLYWRMWTLIAEASFAEASGKNLVVRAIQHTHSTSYLNGPNALRALFSEGQLGIEPFFVTPAMLDANRGLPVKQLMYLLLADNFQAETVFAVTRNWPEIGDVKLVLPSDMDNISLNTRNMVVHSNDLYRLLNYFAVTLGQQTLIDEIGRTVSIFLMRPEGDEAWLGHQSFSMSLPPFRSRRSLHFAWAMQGYELKYRFKKPPFYKLAWIGAIRYMQLALAANTVFNELGVYSALQLQATGVSMPTEWYDELSRLFFSTQRGPELNELIQRVGLRCDWGCIVNKAISSITLVKTKITNLTRVVQWYEWLLFQRMLPEGTWMAGQIGHIKAETKVKPGRSYNPALCGISSGINDVYYRMLTQGIGALKLHVTSFAQGKFIVRDAKALSTCTGFPLDGQFRYIGAADDIHTYYQFVPLTIQDCHSIMEEWRERTELHWQLYCPKKYYHTGVGKVDGELRLESRIDPPKEHLFTNFIHDGIHTFDPVALCDLRISQRKDIRIYGTPEAEGNSSSTTDEEFRKVGPVLLEELEEQVYPIHYCEERKKPSVGVRVLKYGITVKRLWCGVSLLTQEELYETSLKYDLEAELLAYVPQAGGEPAAEWDDLPWQKRRARGKKKKHCKEKLQDIEQKKELAAQQKHIAMSREAELKIEQERARKAAAAELLQKQMPVNVKKRKDEFYGWIKANDIDVGCADKIDVWHAFDGMEDVCLTAPGSKIALQNRYISILQKLDNTDLLMLLQQLPLLARAEFCRCIYNIMGDCVQYLTLSSQNRAVHEQITRFLGAAMDNLAFNGSLNDIELQTTTGNPAAHIEDWKVIGVMDSMDYLNLLMQLCTPVTQADDNATLIDAQKSIDAETLISEQQKQVIMKEPAEETQNFRSATESCSAQSHDLLVPSPEVDGIAHSGETSPRKLNQKGHSNIVHGNTHSPTACQSASATRAPPVHQHSPQTPPTERSPTVTVSKDPVVTTGMMEAELTLPSGSVVLSSADISSTQIVPSGDSSTLLFRKSSQ